VIQKAAKDSQISHVIQLVGPTLLEVPPLPVTPPVTPGRAEIPSLICAVR